MIASQMIKNKVVIKIIGLFIGLAVSLSSLNGQGREYIRAQIEQKGECRNVAITKTNGDLMLFGLNGYATFGCPHSLTSSMEELYNDKAYIDDIQLTEEGRWLILYDKKGLLWNDIPYSLEVKLLEFYDKNEVITAVTFNDLNDWIVITTKYFTSSNGDITNWLKEGSEKYGPLLTASITDNTMVAVFTQGIRYSGNVPQSLLEALEKTKLNVFRLKIAGSSWFFADEEGNYEYIM